MSQRVGQATVGEKHCFESGFQNPHCMALQPYVQLTLPYLLPSKAPGSSTSAPCCETVQWGGFEHCHTRSSYHKGIRTSSTGSGRTDFQQAFHLRSPSLQPEHESDISRCLLSSQGIFCPPYTRVAVEWQRLIIKWSISSLRATVSPTTFRRSGLRPREFCSARSVQTWRYILGMSF